MKKFKFTYIDNSMVERFKIIKAICEELALMIFKNRTGYSTIESVEEL